MKLNHRRCISCGRVALKSEFWRIVRDRDAGALQLDRGMGRSAYICPQVNCLQVAQKKNRLRRSLKIDIVPEVLYQTLWQRLADPIDSSATQNSSTTTPTLELKT